MGFYWSVQFLERQVLPLTLDMKTQDRPVPEEKENPSIKLLFLLGNDLPEVTEESRFPFRRHF